MKRETAVALLSCLGALKDYACSRENVGPVLRSRDYPEERVDRCMRILEEQLMEEINNE